MSSATPSSTGESKSSGNGTSSSKQQAKNKPYTAIWDLDSQGVEDWMHSVAGLSQAKTMKGTAQQEISPELTKVTWTNLKKALEELQANLSETLIPLGGKRDDHGNESDDDDHSDDDEEGRPAKRQKKENCIRINKKGKELYVVVDPYNLYRHTIRKPEDDEEDPRSVEDEAARELKSTSGGKLSQLTVSGLMNGLAGRLDGVVQDKKLHPVSDVPLDQITTANGASFAQLKTLAHILHQLIQTRIEADVLLTTPIRIQGMLAPDLSAAEFKSIRKRVYDTVILGKGLSQPEENDVPTASNQSVHVLDKFKKCASCGNTDQSLFVLDRKNGDVICSICGTVNSESLMHEGSQYRKFEGEADRNHHGDAGNPLLSNSHNMSTTLGGVQVTTGAGMAGFGTQKRGLEIVLRNAHAYTELNISQFGKGDRRTRIGYKDKQKRDAFIQMAHVGDALNLHEAVVQRAKELFAGFRDDRELVQQFKGVIAACLCEAFEQLSSAGRQILKQKEEAPAETFGNPRANRRKELHHANLAGRGGLLLDMDAVAEEQNDRDVSFVTKKPIASWDLEDCRSWFMEASRNIAQKWVDESKKGAKNIPSGKQEELEGAMVEHSITLCDGLESELREHEKKRSDSTRGRVITPRVNDMSKLSIKWQNNHERRSVGNGGVGVIGNSQSHSNGRTAGQLLLLKTAKKFGELIDDKVAGEAIHRELRSVVSKQEAQKRLKLRQEATRQRFAQMKRKPWLQARAQIEG